MSRISGYEKVLISEAKNEQAVKEIIRSLRSLDYTPKPPRINYYENDYDNDPIIRVYFGDVPDDIEDQDTLEIRKSKIIIDEPDKTDKTDIYYVHVLFSRWNKQSPLHLELPIICPEKESLAFILNPLDIKEAYFVNWEVKGDEWKIYPE